MKSVSDILLSCICFRGITTAFCHFCDDLGGRYYGSDQSVFKVIYEKSHNNHNKHTDEKCDCGKQFKGTCEDCKGEKFGGKTNTTEDERRDFAGFGGDDNAVETSRLETLTKTLSADDSMV